MPISVEPGDVEANTRELRLAVVCYGGVSLAIYMHGVTLELQNLFLASEAYAQSQADGRIAPEDNPAPRGSTRHAYWEALRQAHAAGGPVATRVVVDILSGTSAGGINGIVLAKALSRGESQGGLRDVWLKQGSILRLLNPFRGAPDGLLNRVKAILAAPSRARRGPLNGNFLLQQMYRALEGMDDGAQATAERGSGPSPWPVELHVTLTDLMGFPQNAPAWNPKAVKDLRHRYVLAFRQSDDQFERVDNRALAFAARATSSFPGAFPPTRIADIENLGGPWDGLQEFLENYWEIYELSGAQAMDTAFIDGGVLDNAPFDLAIKGIEERPATTEVDRKLLYIQPDPVDPPGGTRPLPGWGKTVWRGVAGIPRREPVLNDLLRIRDRNERVQRVRDVVRAAEKHADRLPDPPDLAGMVDAERAVRELFEDQAMADASYRQLKLYAVVERLAGVLFELCNYPAESAPAFFVRDVLHAWAQREGLLTVDDTRWEQTQLPFLRAFDIAYRERRVRFVIHRLNALYGSAEPERLALDKLKTALYQRMWSLSRLAAAAQEQHEAAAGLRELFGRERVLAYVAGPLDPQAAVEAFLARHSGEMDSLSAQLQEFLSGGLEGFTEGTYSALLEHTKTGWPADARKLLLRSYIAFPIYDAMLFPIRALSDLGELDEAEVIRLSPLDSRLVPVPGVTNRAAAVADKVKGAGMKHFAAFFRRRWRENDYLWGRLDAVERLIWLLVDEQPSTAYKLGMQAVLDEERGRLKGVRSLVGDLTANVAGLPDETRSTPAA